MAMRRFIVPLVVAGGLVAVGTSWSVTARARAAPMQANADGRAAFKTVARVLRHPRCLNCHPSDDRPRIGEDRRLHAMNIKRGPVDRGVAGLHCSACHQPANQDLARVPGAPQWHLAPLSMGWAGLDDHALAEAIKDKRRNGRRSLADLLHHMENDALVAWAWEPGVGLAAPPISHAEFVAAFKTWIESGAASPSPGTTTY